MGTSPARPTEVGLQDGQCERRGSCRVDGVATGAQLHVARFGRQVVACNHHSAVAAEDGGGL